MKIIRRSIKKVFCYLFRKKQKNVTAIEHMARLGNLLYLFLNVDINNKKGNNQFILYTNAMEIWLKRFPELEKFVIREADFKWYDNLDWRKSYFQNFGEDFDKKQLYEFIETNNLFSNNTPFSSIQNEKTIINIRRGDFYVDEVKQPSAFDQVDYVKKALSKYPDVLNFPIQIISDDVEWCEKNLSPLFNELGITVDYMYENGPIEDFEAICSAKILILTNSTFSYWGGYICSYKSNEKKVIAPDFGATFYLNSKAIQLHPEWHLINVI